MFSSATSLEASGEETTRLLNEVDSFQSTVLGLLDEVERRYRAEEKKEENKRGVKREVEEEQGKLVDASNPFRIAADASSPPTYRSQTLCVNFNSEEVHVT